MNLIKTGVHVGVWAPCSAMFVTFGLKEGGVFATEFGGTGTPSIQTTSLFASSRLSKRS